MPDLPVLSREIAQFLESGLSIALATCQKDLQPSGGPAWAVAVEADSRHIIVFVPAEGGAPLKRQLECHPRVAVLFDRPSSHRACQIKGNFVGARKARSAERQTILRQFEDFRADLATIGVPKELTAHWAPWPCLALRIDVAEIFEQTPGPGAGERLR